MTKRSLNVLLIDNDPESCRLVERMLCCCQGAVGYSIEFAHSFKAAMQYLGCKEFDCVLLDIQLPDSKGLESLIRIKQKHPKIPVIIFSAISDDQTCLQAIRNRADDYIVKGRFMRETLGRAICFAILRNNSDQQQAEKENFEKQQEHFRKTEECFKKTEQTLNDKIGTLSDELKIKNDELAKRRGELKTQNVNCEQLRIHISRLKKQFDGIFNSIPSMIWLRDTDGNVITSNKRARQFFYDAIRGVENNEPEKVFTDVLGLSKEDDRFIIASGCPLPTRCVRYADDSGQTINYEVDRVPYTDDKGGIIGILVYVKELPTQVRTEEVQTRTNTETAEAFERRFAVEDTKNANDQSNEDDIIIIDVPDSNKMTKAKKVLIVEDDPLSQMLMNLHLNSLGIDIVTVDNGQKAVDMVRDGKFDLILMDILMPVLKGDQAAKQIRQMGIKTPILAITSFVAGDARQQCLDAGCNDFICKPIIKKEFYNIVSAYLDINISGYNNRARSVKKDQMCLEI